MCKKTGAIRHFDFKLENLLKIIFKKMANNIDDMINVSTQELYRIIDELDSSTSFAPPLPFQFKIEFLEKNNSKIQVSLLIHALIKFNFFFF